jgi:hypothetical protein
MKQYRVTLTFVKDAYLTSAESDWMDLTPGQEDAALKDASDTIKNLLVANRALISFPTGGMECMYPTTYITGVKLLTREKPNE